MGLIDRFIKKKTAAQLNKTVDKTVKKEEKKKEVAEAAKEDREQCKLVAWLIV